MNSYESLLEEACRDGVEVYDYPFTSERIRGLYCDRAIAIRQGMTTVEKSCVLAEIEKIKIGDITDFTNLMGAVIDASAFKTNKEYIDYAKASEDAEVICGGYDDSKGYFVYPTLIEAKKPDFKTMVEEIFGPVMTVYVYPDDKLDETLASCDTATSYGLSGAIFADDREAIVKMEDALKGTAGNFYISQLVQLSVSSRSVVQEHPEPTTKPEARSTCIAG